MVAAAHRVWLVAAKYRAEVRRSFITTTVRDESQVTPQGRHREGSNWRPTASSSMPLPTSSWTRHPYTIFKLRFPVMIPSPTPLPVQIHWQVTLTTIPCSARPPPSRVNSFLARPRAGPPRNADIPIECSAAEHSIVLRRIYVSAAGPQPGRLTGSCQFRATVHSGGRRLEIT